MAGTGNSEGPPPEVLADFEDLLRTLGEEVAKSAVVPAVDRAQAQWTALLQTQGGHIEALRTQLSNEAAASKGALARLQMLALSAIALSAVSVVLVVVLLAVALLGP